MKLIIISTATLEENEISTLHKRKSVDGTKTILHKEELTDLLQREENLSYEEFDYSSKELEELLQQKEWTKAEE